jgi:SLOG family YspA-like protein
VNALDACHQARLAWQRTQPQLFFELDALTDGQRRATAPASPPPTLPISEGARPGAAAAEGLTAKQPGRSPHASVVGTGAPNLRRHTNRVIVCGSRNWHDRERISDVLADAAVSLGTCWLTIVHGNARGADRIAEQEAQKHGFFIESHPADWDAYGKQAGLLRNADMARAGADLCIAFWDGRSTGTKHMIDEAQREGIPVWVVEKHQEV